MEQFKQGELYQCSKYDILKYRTKQEARRGAWCFCYPGSGSNADYYSRELGMPITTIFAGQPFLVIGITVDHLQVLSDNSTGWVHTDNDLLLKAITRIS